MTENPLEQFAEWWREEEVPVVVATASNGGRPSARAVELEGFDERGFVFWSSCESPKGRDLAENPHAALVFVWGTLRQVRAEGRVERVSDDENERHWRGRKGRREIAAFRQSEPVGGRAELAELVEPVPDDPPRPPFWVGYRVVPDRIEFWSFDESFLHDRFSYERTADGWVRTRLQP